MEDERERLGERGVGNAAEQRVIDRGLREDLLDVVPHLVDGNIVSFVIHPLLADARAEVGLVVAPLRSEGVAGAARRLDHDMVGEEARLLFGESQCLEEARDVGRVGLGGWVLLARRVVEILLRMLGERAEARVPDIERLERAAEALLDELRDPRAERRIEHRREERAHLRLGDLALAVEEARNVGRALGIVGILEGVGLEESLPHCIAGVGLARRFAPLPLRCVWDPN